MERATKEVRPEMKKRTDVMLPFGERGETTRELTGGDADMDQAELGSAGSGTSPYGADLSGGGLPTPIEDRADIPQDILPDQVVDWPGQPAEEDEELTAQPTPSPPIDPSQMPS